MVDILQLTEDIPVDDSIYDYEYKEYNPIAGTNLNRGSIVITIESQDIYTHPAESFLVIEGRLIKLAVGPGNADIPYLDGDVISLINNAMMYLFSDIRYHLASHEIEVLQNPGIDPINYKYLFPLYLFDVSKQSEKLKSSVSDIHIKASFNADVLGNIMVYAVIISDRLLTS